MINVNDERNRVLVAIAVSKPDGGLTELPGAIKASERMATWAEANGYKPVLVNDEIFTEVTTALLRTEISDAITQVTTHTVLERLVIFFAGHGASLGIDDQNWMLSNWDKRPNEAVKISSLQRMLEYYGPNQVTIIGDACQEYSTRFMEIVGGPILDKPDEKRQDYELDRFFPVDAGHQAFMIKAQGEEEAFCLFTEVMLNALEGDTAEKYFENINGSLHITSQTMALYLKDNLAKEAGKYGVRMDPRLRPGFYTDRIYYSLPDQQRLGTSSHAPPPHETPRGKLRQFGLEHTGGAPASRAVRKIILTRSLEKSPDNNLVEQLNEWRLANERAYADAADAEFQGHFETGSGLCISGGEILKAYTSQGSLSQESLPLNWYRVQLSDEHDPLLWADIVVELASGKFATACMVQQFVTALHVFKDGGTNVLHRKLSASAEEGKDIFALIGKLNAGVLTEAEIIDTTALLRMRKHDVITVGAIVAQLYDSIRDTRGLRSIAAFYAKNSQPIPLDIILYGGGRLYSKDGALYANVPATEVRKPRSKVEQDRQFTFSPTSEIFEHPVAGRIPWMHQAWSAIETADCDSSAEEWRNLALSVKPHLTRGPFSLINAEGQDALLALAAITINQELLRQ